MHWQLLQQAAASESADSASSLARAARHRAVLVPRTVTVFARRLPRTALLFALAVHLVFARASSPAAALAAAAPADNGPASVATCDTRTARQTFTLDPATGQLISLLDGTCLDGTCADPAGHGCYPLTFTACDSKSDAQKWHYDRERGTLGGGLNVAGGAVGGGTTNCLDVSSAGLLTAVGLYRCDGSFGQMWNISVGVSGPVHTHKMPAPLGVRCLNNGKVPPVKGPFTLDKAAMAQAFDGAGLGSGNLVLVDKETFSGMERPAILFFKSLSEHTHHVYRRQETCFPSPA